MKKRANSKHTLHIVKIKCRNIYTIIHVWTSKRIYNNTKQINSTQLYTGISISEKYRVVVPKIK